MSKDVCVAAESLDEQGAGVGRVGAVRWHVPDLVPGEQARVAPAHRSPHSDDAWGHIVERIGATSADRVAPACPAAGNCGGCAWQHVAYSRQLFEKHARVCAGLLPAVTHAEAAVAEVVRSPQLLGYRNKGKYVIARADAHATSRIILGGYAPRSHRVVSTLGCRVVAPVIDEVATLTRAAIEESSAVPYDERTAQGDLRYLVLRANADGDVLAALVVRSPMTSSSLTEIARRLALHPAVRGVVAVHNDRPGGVIIPTAAPISVLAGTGTIAEDLFGIRVELGATEFSQVNREQAAHLYRRVVALAEVDPKSRVLDLYAGLGGIGIGLAQRGASVVSLEVEPAAVLALRRAIAGSGLDLRPECGDAGTASAHAPVDVVVVNPPRKGLSADTRKALVTLAPPTILYVSCGPQSLGRDLAELAAHGYSPDVIEPFDLMPGTAQVETIVRLR